MAWLYAHRGTSLLKLDLVLGPAPSHRKGRVWHHTHLITLNCYVYSFYYGMQTVNIIFYYLLFILYKYYIIAVSPRKERQQVYDACDTRSFLLYAKGQVSRLS